MISPVERSHFVAVTNVFGVFRKCFMPTVTLIEFRFIESVNKSVYRLKAPSF